MKVIHKHPLKLADEQQLWMPEDSVMLAVQVQRGEICLWVEKEAQPKLADVRWVFTIMPTGQVFNAGNIGSYIGTIQLRDEALVFHIYGRKSP